MYLHLKFPYSDSRWIHQTAALCLLKNQRVLLLQSQQLHLHRSHQYSHLKEFPLMKPLYYPLQEFPLMVPLYYPLKEFLLMVLLHYPQKRVLLLVFPQYPHLEFLPSPDFLHQVFRLYSPDRFHPLLLFLPEPPLVWLQFQQYALSVHR